MHRYKNHYQLPGSQPMSCASFWALWVYSWGLNPLFNDDVLCKIRLWLFWRCKGYERTSLTTYNLIAGLQVCASSLGSMIAPPISGVVTRTLGYPWNQTLLAFMAFIMVSSGTAIIHNRNKWAIKVASKTLIIFDTYFNDRWKTLKTWFNLLAWTTARK